MPRCVSRSFPAVGVALFCLMPVFAHPPGPSSEGYKWRTSDKNGDDAPISGFKIGSFHSETGSPPARYVPVNSTYALGTQPGSDIDSFCLPEDEGGDGLWHNYSDDISSGWKSHDFHVKWEISGDGEFATNSGVAYGGAVRYRAPEYQSGSNLRTVTIKATADDVQRNGDEFGASGDQEVSDTMELKIWQVDLSIRNRGGQTRSSENDAPAVPDEDGGGRLGYISPQDLYLRTFAGVENHVWGVELVGEIPAGPSVTSGFVILNEKQGKVHYLVGQAGTTLRSVTQYDVSGGYEFDFGSGYHWADEDSNHLGVDSRKIFALDTPGHNTHINRWISRYGRKNLYFDIDFRAEISWGGVPVSKELFWTTYHELVVNSVDEWRTASENHTP